MRKNLLALLLVFLLLLTACAPAAEPPAEPPEELPTSEPAPVPEPEPEPEPEEPPLKHEVVVYFANWYLDTKTAQEGAEVCSIPWDNVTYINHAFWAVEPADGSSETSFDRRDRGDAPRTQFRVASTLPEADFDNQDPSDLAQGLPRNHFAQYEAYSKQYPDVNILISIGGWTRCGFFSEMAYTAEGRASFVQSCMDVLKQYPWIDGFDVDWEYFGGSKDGERYPEDEIDQGCPIWGTPEEDSENFGLLAQALRAAMDEAYGPGVKKLTACASASYGWTLPCQNWRLVAPSMDLINIMTYDLAGMWDKMTGHASKPGDVQNAVSLMLNGYKADPAKVCIGTPFYATDYEMLKAPATVKGAVGMAIAPKGPAQGEVTQTDVRAFEAEAVSGYRTDWVDGKPVRGETYGDESAPGWHFAWDELARAPYLFNNDENSPYYLWYLSYENPISLQLKLDLIESYSLAGIIVWECSEDTYDHQMIGQIADDLLK